MARKTIAISEECHKKLTELISLEHRSRGKEIEYLIDRRLREMGRMEIRPIDGWDIGELENALDGDWPDADESGQVKQLALPPVKPEQTPGADIEEKEVEDPEEDVDLFDDF